MEDGGWKMEDGGCAMKLFLHAGTSVINYSLIFCYVNLIRAGADMKAKIIFLVLLFLGFSYLHAQNAGRDSLFYKLQFKGKIPQKYIKFFDNLDNSSLKAADGTRYFIKKYIPPKDIDYKILVVTPDPNIDYKILKKDFTAPAILDKKDDELLNMLRKKFENRIK